MARAKTIFVCQQCGAESPKWMGKCPACREWNTMAEMAISIRTKSQELKIKKAEVFRLSQIKSITRGRIRTRIEEFDRVLGGGIVPGSVVLIAGEPGIGKSTLMLQLVAKTGGLYVSGEESLEQLKIRAERLGMSAKGRSTSGGKGKQILFLAETDVDSVINTLQDQLKRLTDHGAIAQRKINIVVVDSIQAMQTSDLSGVAGSIGQVRECSVRLLKIGKSRGIPIFLIGHITKTGAIAGPKILEHMVDTVVYFEGERFGAARLLRATKNRFGATDEVGVFEMADKGLKEVTNPSKLFLKKRLKKVPGSVVVTTMEGTRPVLVEIQALVVPTQLAVPRRIGRGVDYHRLQLICAVLTKRLSLPLGSFDIFVNIAGGLRVEEPAADLGIALAIISSFKNIPLDDKLVAFAELGLLGELREVSQAKKRAKEACRLGFTTIISPQKFTSINQVAKNLLGKVNRNIRVSGEVKQRAVNQLRNKTVF